MNTCIFQVSKLKEQLESTTQKLNESREVLKTNENGEEVCLLRSDPHPVVQKHWSPLQGCCGKVSEYTVHGCCVLSCTLLCNGP